ncbi:hypothetical protein FGIG_05540 [Fasciola gigantica]|uniref:Autophagy-related protein 2 n=1 Tax=Fasciola gigantica TaxID=46835 RepID=A0A504YPJ1_FASGI|nr:hypothetical protein FGIG_05540 [Fasciola gigantica]
MLPRRLLSCFLLYVISFTDRLRGSSDRVSRGVSDQTAVKLSGIVRYTSSLGPSSRERHAPDHSSWPVAPSWNQLEYQNSTVLSGLVEVACCRIDVDLSLADRVHRITDAMAAASEAKETQQLNDLRKTLWSTGTPLWFCPADLSPIEFDSRNPEKHTQPNTIGLAWWRRTLRPEHLRIGLDKLTLKYQIGLKPATDWVADDLAGQDSTSEVIGSEIGAQKSHVMEGNDKTGPLVGEEDSQVELSMRSVIVHWFHGRWKVQSAPLIHLSAANQMPTDLITVTLHLAAPGRTDLIEKPTDPHVKLHEFSPSEQVYTYSQQRQQRFEMGVDLANATNISTGTTAVEWSLWKKTGPKQNFRTPFVIRRNFLQDAPKMHSKQTTYYPGDSNHLEVFRRSASLHTRLHIKCTLPVFLVQVENKRTMELTYTRGSDATHKGHNLDPNLALAFWRSNRSPFQQLCLASGARHARSRNRARTPSDDSDDPGLVTEVATTVQRQSTCTVQLDVGNLEARFTLPGRHVSSTKPDLVRIVATDGTVFAELGHDGAPNVNFFTIELTKLEIFFSPCSGEGNVTNEGAGDCGSNWWPCLLWLSWSSIGYPLSQKLGIPSDSGAYSGAGPMFTLAVEHRQSQRSHPVSGIPVYRDDIVLAVRLQDSCLAHWPNLEPIPDAGASSAGLPNWLTKLLLLFETPAIPVVKLLWPGYQLTDALFIQHVHLERSLFTWSSPEMDPGIPSMCYYMIPSLRSVRALIGCESISVTVNTASDALLTAMDNTVPATGNIAMGAGVATTTPSPGILVMSFVSNAALFICPIPRTDANTPSFLTRTDVRFTNNLLRLHTCADSLAAMQILIQSLTPPDSRSVPSGQTKPHVDNDGPGISGPKVESPAHLMTKGASRFGSHSSLHSNSPHQMDHRLSMDNQMASGSGSSVEDLLQGAISDAESLHSSPHKRDRFEPEFSSKGRQRDSPRSRHEFHRPPESGPRKTQLLAEPTFSNLYPRWNSDDFPHADRPPSPDPQPSTPSSDSSPTEFVVIKPSMIPSRAINLVGLKDQIRCLVPFSSPGSSEAQTGGGVTVMLITASTGSVTDQLRNSSHSSQTPTPEHKHVARPNSGGSVSMTVGGPDGRLLSAKGGAEVGSGASKIAGLQPGVRFRHDRPVASLVAHTISSPGSSATSGGNTTTMTTTGTGASHIPVRGADQPFVMISPQELYARGGRSRDASKCISLRLNKFYFRHSAFPECGHKNSNANEPPTGSGRPPVGDPASRFVLNIGSLVILDRIANSRINQLLYTFNPSTSTGSVVPHSTDTPLLRAALVCWRVPTDTECASSPVPTDIRTVADTPDLELEAKISVQPLRINVDQFSFSNVSSLQSSACLCPQNTLLFIEEFQQLFSSFSVTAADAVEPPTNATHATATQSTHPPQSYSTTSVDDTGRSVLTDNRVTTNPLASLTTSRGQEDNQSSRDETKKLTERPSIFIRKVTFYPDLPIRLDYHGRHLDFSAGSLQGFWRMLLQLNNGELVIPRRVYQRGYPNLERLLEEVMADLRVTIAAQLPQLICTGLGPMHEVRLFLLGLWDLVYQPVHSVYQGARDSSRVRDVQWPATEWDLSTCDLSAGSTGFDRRSSGGAGGFIQGLRRGTRSFSSSTLWATLQLSIQSVRVVQSIAETAYDLVTPGPALRSRQLRLRQPADLREGFGNAMNAMTRGFQMVTEDLCGATRLQSEVDFGYKGPVGMVGDVLRQIPPTIVAPVVAGCEVAANILGGFRNQLRPEAKVEDEQKWKDTHGL